MSPQAPLLILHGENDPQVPPYESAQFVRALRENRKVFYYFSYPNELHDLATIGWMRGERNYRSWKNTFNRDSD